jgi:hypothetical protein
LYFTCIFAVALGIAFGIAFALTCARERADLASLRYHMLKGEFFDWSPSPPAPSSDDLDGLT